MTTIVTPRACYSVFIPDATSAAIDSRVYTMFFRHVRIAFNLETTRTMCSERRTYVRIGLARFFFFVRFHIRFDNDLPARTVVCVSRSARRVGDETIDLKKTCGTRFIDRKYVHLSVYLLLYILLRFNNGY